MSDIGQVHHIDLTRFIFLSAALLRIKGVFAILCCLGFPFFILGALETYLNILISKTMSFKQIKSQGYTNFSNGFGFSCYVNTTWYHQL